MNELVTFGVKKKVKVYKCISVSFHAEAKRRDASFLDDSNVSVKDALRCSSMSLT